MVAYKRKGEIAQIQIQILEEENQTPEVLISWNGIVLSQQHFSLRGLLELHLKDIPNTLRRHHREYQPYSNHSRDSVR